MYISNELHEILCDIGLTACGIFFVTVAIAMALPWLKLLASLVKNELEYLYHRAEINWWYYRGLARIKRDKRRRRAAERVFDEPIRWSVK